MSHARAGRHDKSPPEARETEDILASILNAAASTADQGPQADEQLGDEEPFAAFMASCRDGPPTTGPTTKSTLRRGSHEEEPTSPARDPASASHWHIFAATMPP